MVVGTFSLGFSITQLPKTRAIGTVHMGCIIEQLWSGIKGKQREFKVNNEGIEVLINQRKCSFSLSHTLSLLVEVEK
jgi:hypothetical protein